MVVVLFFVFFKQRTAYDVRISDWSSDVCSSDLRGALADAREPVGDRGMIVEGQPDGADRARPRPACDVGDRIFLGQIVGLAQPSVEDVEQTQRFAPIAEIGRASGRERVCQNV